MTRRHRTYVVIAAVAGVALFAWTIWSVGAATLAAQLRALAPVLPFILALAGVRFLLQAAGWRLAMPPDERASWHEAFAAVIAGEAAGYFAWGPVTREPMKALLVAHRVPERTALAAAVVERCVYSIAATLLIVAAIAIAAVRYHFVGSFLIGLAVTAAAVWLAKRHRKRSNGMWQYQGVTLGAIAAYAAAQEISNIVEAYVVLGWLGASPTLESVVILEGIGRLLNSAGQFIPGKLGVTEAVTTAMAEGLRLGGAHGLSLALARRARSLAWGAVGIALVIGRAVNWRELRNDAIRYLRDRRDAQHLQAQRLLHRAAVD